MLSHSSVFTSPLGRSPPFWVSFPDMVAAVTMACVNSIQTLLSFSRCISQFIVSITISASPWSCVFVWVHSARGGRGWCRPWACRASPEIQRQTGWGRWSGWWFGCTSRQRQGECGGYLSHCTLSETGCVIIQLQNTPDAGQMGRKGRQEVKDGHTQA